MTGTVIGNSTFMDAIGMSVGLAGASFGSNEGYTILAGEFVSSTTRPIGSPGTLTALIKEFASPVNGIMGWFGSDGNNISTAGALSNASSRFVNNVAKNPLFITPSAHYSSSNWGGQGTANYDTLYCIFTPGTSTSVTFSVYTLQTSYAAFCCYFYIFF